MILLRVVEFTVETVSWPESRLKSNETIPASSGHCPSMTTSRNYVSRYPVRSTGRINDSGHGAGLAGVTRPPS